MQLSTFMFSRVVSSGYAPMHPANLSPSVPRLECSPSKTLLETHGNPLRAGAWYVEDAKGGKWVTEESSVPVCLGIWDELPSSPQSLRIALYRWNFAAAKDIPGSMSEIDTTKKKEAATHAPVGSESLCFRY